MRLLKALLVVMILVMSAVCSSTATAETARVKDPAGDGEDGRALDITSLKVDSQDAAVVTRVTFARAAAGDLYFTYWVRGAGGLIAVQLLNRHHLAGQDRNTLESWNGSRHRVINCKRLSVVWDNEAETVEVRFPSRCLAKGNYGAIRARVIAERGSDADYAPKNDRGGWRWTRWISRG